MASLELERIVNACARRLGSRAGKEERGFLGKVSKSPRAGSQGGSQAVPGGFQEKPKTAQKFSIGAADRRHLLVPNASRQEAEANSLFGLFWAPSPCIRNTPKLEP